MASLPPEDYYTLAPTLTDDACPGVSGWHKVVACCLCGKAAGKTDWAGRPVCLRCAAGTPDPAARSGPPAGRNDPCPCGSGKKRKRCCQ